MIPSSALPGLLVGYLAIGALLSLVLIRSGALDDALTVTEIVLLNVFWGVLVFAAIVAAFAFCFWWIVWKLAAAVLRWGAAA